MSSQYLNKSTPNQDINIKINHANINQDLDLRGELYLAQSAGLITLPRMAIYQQYTSETQPVTISGAENQFKITTANESNFNPATTRLFTINHSGMKADTMVLINKSYSTATNMQLIAWIAYTDVGSIRVGIHNLSTIVAVGAETILFTLIHTMP
tara:strand:+ start:341 stop:805 length:465 start_codon:yes stop_codon:yes gene_type:complete